MKIKCLIITIIIMLLIGSFGCDVLDDYLGIERNVSNTQNTSDDGSDEQTTGITNVYKRHLPDAYIEGDLEPPADDMRYEIKEQILEQLNEEERRNVIVTIANYNIKYERGYVNGKMFSDYVKEESDSWQYAENYKDTFIDNIKNVRDLLHNDILRNDLDEVVDLYLKACDTHDRNYLISMYYILHDMDYYLLRDGRKLFEQMQYSDGYHVDVSTVWKYYGVLKVYN